MQDRKAANPLVLVVALAVIVATAVGIVFLLDRGRVRAAKEWGFRVREYQFACMAVDRGVTRFIGSPNLETGSRAEERESSPTTNEASSRLKERHARCDAFAHEKRGLKAPLLFDQDDYDYHVREGNLMLAACRESAKPW